MNIYVLKHLSPPLIIFCTIFCVVIDNGIVKICEQFHEFSKQMQMYEQKHQIWKIL